MNLTSGLSLWGSPAPIGPAATQILMDNCVESSSCSCATPVLLTDKLNVSRVPASQLSLNAWWTDWP